MRDEDAVPPAAEPHGAQEPSLGAQHVRRGQGGVAAQFGLDARGEPADGPVGLGLNGQREGESGLRVVHLGRDLPHPGILRPLPGGQQAHTCRIPGKRTIGEGVDDVHAHVANVATPMEPPLRPIRNEWPGLGRGTRERPQGPREAWLDRGPTDCPDPRPRG